MKHPDKPEKRVANEKKLDTCVKYKDLLEIIGKVNKGYILNKQLEEYALLLELVENKYRYKLALEELERNQIIKKVKFANTTNNIIMLKKYGIRYIEGKTAPKYNSGSVGAIKTCTTNNRYLKNIFFNNYILYILKLNTKIREHAKRNGILETFKMAKLNIVRDNISFMDEMKKYKEDVDIKYIDSVIDTLKKEKEHKKNIAESSRQIRLGLEVETKEIKKETKEQTYYNGFSKSNRERMELMQNGNLETLKRKNSYLTLTQGKEGTYKLTITCMDWSNSQNRLKIIENLALIISIASNMFNSNINWQLKLELLVYNKEAKEEFTKILNNKEAIQDTLNSFYGINLSLDKIGYNAVVTSVDVVENYFNNRTTLDFLDKQEISKKEEELQKKEEELQKREVELQRKEQELNRYLKTKQ